MILIALGSLLLLALVFTSLASGQTISRNLRYADPAHERQVLDVHAPVGAKDLPVVFWIHGGGWQAGDKTSVQAKPRAFMNRGFVFVSTNYRLLPAVDMETIIRDVAKSLHWVHAHIAEYGGDPDFVAITGPNRRIARALGYHEAAPHGDMMLAGSWGLVEGVRLLHDGREDAPNVR